MKHDEAQTARNVLRPSDFVTAASVAAELGVSAETVRRWIRQGRIAAFRVGPRRLRIDPASIAGMVTPR